MDLGNGCQHLEGGETDETTNEVLSTKEAKQFEKGALSRILRHQRNGTFPTIFQERVTLQRKIERRLFTRSSFLEIHPSRQLFGFGTETRV